MEVRKLSSREHRVLQLVTPALSGVVATALTHPLDTYVYI
jgi:hypothetical protein